MNLLLVDGTNAIMRRVTAVKGVDAAVAAEDTVARILRAARDLKATHLIVALDDPHEGWRYQLFPDYKGAQTAPGESTHPYSWALGEALELQRVCIQAAKGYEADDVIATLAARAGGSGHTVWVLSSDTDLYQLLALPNVRIVQFGAKGEPWLVERTLVHCIERFGVEPSAVPDFNALVGGKNKVPGVPKIGAKTAAKLLHDRALEDVIADGKIPAEHVDWVRVARKLHTLATDAPLGLISPKACRVL